MVVGRLLLLVQLKGWLVHIPRRGRNNVSRRSRRGQGKGAGSDKSLAKGHLRRDKVCSGRDRPHSEWVELSRARWLQYSGGRSGAPGTRRFGGGCGTSTLEISDGRELAARRKQLSGRAGYRARAVL